MNFLDTSKSFTKELSIFDLTSAKKFTESKFEDFKKKAFFLIQSDSTNNAKNQEENNYD